MARIIERIKKQITTCQLCGSTKKLEAHHIDKNRENNSLENLIVVCKKCHWGIFHKGKHEGKGNPMYGKNKSGTICKNGKLFGQHNSYANADYKKKQSQLKSGSNNPMWKGGKSNTYKYKKEVRE